MEYIDYYKILEIDKNASEAEIKKAYRKLARKFHPDLNPNDKESERKFKEINEANEVLSNVENRKKYDQYGKDWKHADDFEKSKQHQSKSQRSQSTNFSESGFSDFFSTMFNQDGASNSRSNVKFKGKDYHSELEFDIKDVYKTFQKIFNINGKDIRLTVLAGIDNGQVIRLKGYGGEGMNGGPNGDLYIKFNILNSTMFKRDKENLYTPLNIDLYTAVLGGDLIFETIDGKVKIKIKPETQNGHQIKLKGKGFPLYKKEGEFGDLYITLNVNIPQNLSEEEKKQFENLAKLRS